MQSLGSAQFYSDLVTVSRDDLKPVPRKERLGKAIPSSEAQQVRSIAPNRTPNYPEQRQAIGFGPRRKRGRQRPQVASFPLIVEGLFTLGTIVTFHVYTSLAEKW